MDTFIPSLTLIFAVLFIWLLKVPAQRWKLVDSPGGRKMHDGVIPLTGGIAIFLSFIIVQMISHALMLPLVLGITAMVLLGMADDFMDLSPRLRLLAQTAVVLMTLIWSNTLIKDLGDLFGAGVVELGQLSVPFTLVCSLGLINAINMIDGIDGFASGIVAAALLWFIAAGWLAGSPLSSEAITLLFAVLGFMAFNAPHPFRRKAATFLGDSGSMGLGLALAYLAIRHGQDAQRVLSPMSVAWILALPVIDTIRVMALRLSRGGSLFAADRCHIHHVLIDAGLTARKTAWLLILTGLILGAVGVAGHYFGLRESWLALAFIGLIVVNCLLVKWIEGRKLKFELTYSTASESLGDG
jgi:UDP-GlcNAc:undecaprenyl-phosphate GlcNAc-1-phosphate transferase